MKIWTSNFSKSGADPRSVAICRGIPLWYHGKRMIELAPTAELLAWIRKEKPTIDVWAERYYREVLLKQNPEYIAQLLGDDAILLCWESDPKDCHRGIVGEWLRRGAQVEVGEIPTKAQLSMSLNVRGVEQVSLF